jgi:hypothetical protein
MPCFFLYTLSSEISPGLQICLLKLIKVNFLTEYNACGHDASVVAYFVFSGSCSALKPLKIAFPGQ